MSSITRQGNKLIQRAGGKDAELGHIELDNNSHTYVLWLKDTCGVLGSNGSYIRGDEFSSIDEARNQVLSSPSAFIMHSIWMRNSVKKQALEAVEANWDEISSELRDHSIAKDDLRERLSSYLERQPIATVTQWSKRIMENLIIKTIIEFILGSS